MTSPYTNHLNVVENEVWTTNDPDRELVLIEYVDLLDKGEDDSRTGMIVVNVIKATRQGDGKIKVSEDELDRSWLYLDQLRRRVGKLRRK